MKIYKIKGAYVNESGSIIDDAPRYMEIFVIEGAAYVANLGDYKHRIAACRYGDGDWLGDRFSVDAGEFERAGIVPKLCGSATI